MAIKRTMWKSEKNTNVFETEEEALEYDRVLDIIEYVDDHPIYGPSEGCRIVGKDFMNWIKLQKRIYIQLLPKEKEEKRNENDNNSLFNTSDKVYNDE